MHIGRLFSLFAERFTHCKDGEMRFGEMSIHLSIVIPLYNEEESIERLLDNVLQVGKTFSFAYEIILVDDGSEDDTWQKIDAATDLYTQIVGIRFRKNYGQTSAMVAGFEYARGRIIATLDGDMQNDPADIPILLKKLDEGYDIVSGWRKNRRDHFSRVLLSRIANKIISFTTGVNLHDCGCSLKVYRAECIKSIKAYGEMHRFFPALASMTGARVAEVPVNHHPRRFGTSKYGFSRILKVFTDIFSLNLIIRFSAMPLKGFALSSLPFMAISVFFLLLSILAWMKNYTPGKAFLFILASALFGMVVIHTIILGILGELIVGTSDLSHEQLADVTMKHIDME